MIVNQARVLAYLREHMERSPSRLNPFYGLQAYGRRRRDRRPPSTRSRVTLRHTANSGTGETSVSAPGTSSAATARAARSAHAIGRALPGDATNQAWGVMDVLAVTDFPDIRLKCAIHSANEGNMLIIPREGGYLVRLYIELDRPRPRTMLGDRQRHPGEAGRGRQPDPAPVHARRQGRRLVVGLRDRPAAVRPVRRRRPPDEMRHPAAAGVHRRRRLPHAQRQGRPGHERLDGRTPGTSAGSWPPCCGARPSPSCCTPTRPSARPSPQRADRLRPRVRRACSAPAPREPVAPSGRRRSGRVPAVLRQQQGRFTAGVATATGRR